MMLRWLLAALHLLALGIGLGAIFARARAARAILQEKAVQRVLVADNFWALAAVLWIGTGLLRAFGGYEKGTAYYMTNTLFWVKMALLGGILALEAWPIVHLIGWRRRLGAGGAVDTASAGRLAAISYVQAVLVVLMVLAATAMARGLGM